MDVLPELSHNNVCQPIANKKSQVVQKELSKVAKESTIQMLTRLPLKVCPAVEVPC
jgi:hypothetical protein